jgi:acyl-homoserine-lactone acylase
MRLPTRSLGVLAATTLLTGLVVAPAANAGPDGSIVEPANGAYRATITRTEHGIPHIVARDYGSLGFGNGYATAETSICVIADTVITGRGLRSYHFGPDKP